MILNGRNLIVKSNGVAIACARSCELDIDSEVIEVASPSSGRSKEYIAGRKSWSVNVGHLVKVGTNKDNLRSAIAMPGQTVTLVFCVEDGLMYKWEGSAICTKAKLTGTIGNLAQGSFSFQGSGELKDSFEDTYCKGILLDRVAATVEGIYLVTSREGIPPHSVVYYKADGTQIQMTPSADITYHVSNDEYLWDGSKFVKQ